MKKYCPECKTDTKVIKYGTRDGVQRYKCQSCDRQFFELAHTYSIAVKYLAVELYWNGIPTRLIAKLLEIKSHSSILYWDKDNDLSVKLQHLPIKQKDELKDILHNLRACCEVVNELKSLSGQIAKLEEELKNQRMTNTTIDDVQIDSKISENKRMIDNLYQNYDSLSDDEKINLRFKVWPYEEEIKSLKTKKQADIKNDKTQIIKEIEDCRLKEKELKSQYTFSEELKQYSEKVIEVIDKILAVINDK